MTIKKLLIAAAAVALTSTSASAQFTVPTDNIPVATGGSLGGSVAPLGVPGAAGVGNFASSFAGAGAGGVAVSNPAGGTVTVPAAVAQALGALLNGTGTAADIATATAAFGGTPQAGALANSLNALGQAINAPGGTAAGVATAASNAINAYNAAVDAVPAGQSIPALPGLLGARGALVGFTQ